MNKVVFIEIGMGIDLHGQDVTTACIRACRDAIGHNSLPGITDLLPGGNRDAMQVRITLGVPFHHDSVDVGQVKAVFPYGQKEVNVVQGGLLASSGVVLPDKGDTTDELVIVNAVVEVGY
jgi:uncharacterized protein (TIGR02058 family)